VSSSSRTDRTPDTLCFLAPQYTTWIELTDNQNERDILAYVQSRVESGLPPGVFMIDDTWQAGDGDWRREPCRCLQTPGAPTATKPSPGRRR